MNSFDAMCRALHGEAVGPAPHGEASTTATTQDQLRQVFERINRDSYGFRRSHTGTYVNPAVARDWKWFLAGWRAAQPDGR